MKKPVAPYVLVCITFAVNFAADRITKLLAELYLQGRPPTGFLKDIIIITYTENTGAFLSLGRNWPIAVKHALLLVIPVGICLFVLGYCLFRERNPLRIIHLTTIVAGGLSNLIDRSFNNFAVVDFLNFGIGRLRTGILNVADLSVTFGGIALILSEAKKKDAPAQQ